MQCFVSKCSSLSIRRQLSHLTTSFTSWIDVAFRRCEACSSQRSTGGSSTLKRTQRDPAKSLGVRAQRSFSPSPTTSSLSHKLSATTRLPSRGPRPCRRSCFRLCSHESITSTAPDAGLTILPTTSHPLSSSAWLFDHKRLTTALRRHSKTVLNLVCCKIARRTVRVLPKTWMRHWLD